MTRKTPKRRRSWPAVLAELRELRARTVEAEDALAAIRGGEVDAIVVCSEKGEQVFTLTGTESVYRLIVETMKEAALTLTLDGTILFCNAQFGQLIGRPPEQVVGHNLLEFVAADSRESARSLLTITPRQPVRQRLVFARADQSAAPAHVSSNLLSQADGPSICIVAADLTELENSTELIQQLRIQQKELGEAKSAAEEASKAKDRFIAILSHELRTPLTPALAAVAALEADSRLPADVCNDLAMVHRNINLEVRLIADLLDVSRIRSGKLHLDERTVDVAAVIREAARTVSADVSAKGLALTVETPGAPYWMRGDGDRLQQVFWNLLRNAVKFTPQHGRISVRAALVPSEECPRAREVPPPAADARRPADDNHQCSGNLVVDVTDNGAGVAPDLLPRLFDAFEQAGSSSTSGGLGLGLTICKAVVEMHGGSIAMHSDGPGRGTSVTVKLPMPRCPLSSTVEPVSQPPDEPADVSPDERPRGRLKIVLVEDHAETAQVLRRLLASRGHEVTTAEGIVTGLAAVERIDPDVLISDLGLPDGNGLDLMRQLLKRGKRIPAIALSGYGSPADIQKSMAAGFLEHLVKPLCSVDALTDALGRLNLRTRNP